MKILLESLEPYRRYAVQVRGPDTEWSPTYIIHTERDRIAPPQVPSITIEGSDEGSANWYWYDRNLVLTWANYAISDQSTWDHSHYMIQFVAHDDRVAIFQSASNKFVLTQALNAQNFGGKGLPAFKRISIWGVDRTGNPSYAGSPWADGPDFAGTMKSTTYTTIINPPPTQLVNFSADFETKDLIFKWDKPTGNVNLDVENIKIVLNGTQTFYTTANSTGYTLTYEENVAYFGFPGDPTITYDIRVIDAFDQESTPITGTATNYPPTEPVTNLISVGIEGGISVTFADVKTTHPTYKDHRHIQLSEKIMTSNTDTDGTQGVVTVPPWRRLAAVNGTEYAFIPDDPSFAYRWIRAQYVDWFYQTGPVTNSGGSYPVRMKSAVTIQAFAPPAPTNLAVTNSITGDALSDGQVYLTWTPPEGDLGEVLFGYTVQYQRVSPLTANIPSWAPHKVNANRKYVKDIQSSYTKIVFDDAHNFKVGDRISVVNYGTMQHRIVTSVETSAIYVSALTPATLIDNSFDRSKAGTAVVSSSTTISLMPGTQYQFRVASESSTFTSEYSSTVTHTTSGNPLIAKKPLEAGTYYDPVSITAYSITNNRVTVTTSEDPTHVSKGFSNALSKYVSITDSIDSINGRWPIVSVSSNTIVFDVNTTADASGSTTGKATAGMFALGAQVNGTNDGLYMNESNLWLVDTGAFRAGNGYGTGSWSGIEWNPTTSTFSVVGDVTARSGYFTGNVMLTQSGALVVGESYKIDDTRSVTISGTTVTIPVLSATTIPSVAGKYVQILCSNTSIDTQGTPVSATGGQLSGANKTIIVTHTTGLGNGSYSVNGTVMLNAVTSMGERGLMSTNAAGQIKFMLTQSGLNRIGGWDITNNALKSISTTPVAQRAGISADANLDSFWAGGDSGSAVFRVNEDGNMYLGSLSFKGVTSPTRIYSGVDAYGNVNTPFYLDSDGKFSLKNKFKIDVSGSSTLVTIGDTVGQQFFFNAGSSPKFYQGVGTHGNSNTKIYLDFDGNFSISDFLTITSTSAVFKIGSLGSVNINQTYSSTANVTIAPSSSYLTPSANNSFIFSRDSGNAPNAYAAAIYFPTNNGGARTYISSDPEVYPLNIVSARGGQTISQLITSDTHDDTTLWSRQSLSLTANGYDLILYAERRLTLRTNSQDIDIYAPYSTVQSTGQRIHWNGTTGEYVFDSWPPSSAATYEVRMGASGEIKIRNDGASSRTVKNNIKYLSISERVTLASQMLSLEPATFTYKPVPQLIDTRTYTGYIVEDLIDNNIEWPVERDEFNNPVRIDYDKLTVGLVELAKNQNQQIDTLNQTVLQLEERLSALEER